MNLISEQVADSRPCQLEQMFASGSFCFFRQDNDTPGQLAVEVITTTPVWESLVSNRAEIKNSLGQGPEVQQMRYIGERDADNKCLVLL